MAQTNPCDRNGPSYSNLPGDTTVTFPLGITITMNRCEFFDIRNCLEVIPITTPEQLETEGLDMRDNRGRMLVSCGMIKFDMKACKKSCFEVPIKFRISVRFPDCRGVDRLPLLFWNDGEGWEKPSNVKFSFAVENGVRYLEFVTNCPPKFINCDICVEPTTLFFKARRGTRIESLKISVKCPVFFYKHNTDKSRRKAKVKMLCVNPDSVTIKAVIVRKDGDPVWSDSIGLNRLDHGLRKVYCREIPASFFSRILRPFKRGKGSLYRKYFLSSTAWSDDNVYFKLGKKRIRVN